MGLTGGDADSRRVLDEFIHLPYASSRYAKSEQLPPRGRSGRLLAGQSLDA
jgi:hypothetical protein